jgi:Leucine-rich repeat (LRR) protein
MKSLEVLVLAGNQLKEVPAEIENLDSLRELLLDKNDIETLPTSLKNCANLQVISLTENPISPEQVSDLSECLHVKIDT